MNTRKHFPYGFTILSLLILLLGLSTVSPMAQSNIPVISGNSWEAKHFREALLRGRSYRKYYQFINDDKSKVITAETLKEFCRKHKFDYLEDYETKEVKRFGDFTTSVYKFHFVPESLWIDYVFEWTDRTEAKAGDLKSNGSAYFFNPDVGGFVCLRDHVRWTGTLTDGWVDGVGAGIYQLTDHIFYYFSGIYQNGFPVGHARYRIIDTTKDGWEFSPREKQSTRLFGQGAPFHEVVLGPMHEGMALFQYIDNGESRKEGSQLYGYANQNGAIIIKPTYQTASSFSGGKAIVQNEKEEFIYIDKTGTFIDYTDRQKKLFDREKARQDSLNLAKERERILAEQKAAEEQRLAAAKEANLRQRIEANKNTRLWTRGSRLCYRYPSGNEYVLATLEEWNSNRTKVKVKIVASPSATRTLNGDLLEKNNTMWVSARNEGWHLALDEEIEIALRNDESIRKQEPTRQVIVQDERSKDCPECNGRGVKPCSSCDATGIMTSWFSDDKICTDCRGKGQRRCFYCSGSGRKR